MQFTVANPTFKIPKFNKFIIVIQQANTYQEGCFYCENIFPMILLIKALSDWMEERNNNKTSNN